MELLNKANQLRLNKKFADSLDIYLDILKMDPNFPEANWGALLSEYGVEYIEDDGKRIPTLHRPVQNYRITEDKFAVNLLSNLSGSDRIDYQKKIKTLEELRLKIEDNSSKDSQYEVFISCKITIPDSAIDEKTPEYEWGKQIYQRLSQRGLKVFFSPVSLPATNGAYEPIIYSALQSARYLIILASEPEYLESTWIKNEWERYRTITKRSTNINRYIKLVIDRKVAKDVPAVLKQESSHIEYGEGRHWLTYLEKAVLDVFPEYQNIKYDALSGGLIPVDFSSIQKRGNKKYNPIKTTTIETYNLMTLRNPYEVHYANLHDDYTLEENVETCIRRVQIHLRNTNFSEAKRELNAYLSFMGYRSNLDYNILILEMLISSQCTSLTDFFKEKIKLFTDFTLFSEITAKLSTKSVDEFLKPLADYILQSIHSGLETNAFEFY
jgi:hypothetical protein